MFEVSFNDLIGTAAMLLLVSGTAFQAIKVYKTKQSKDLSFAWASILWVGTLLLMFYGWNLQSWPLVIFNGISLLFVTYIWGAMYDDQPVRIIKPYLMSTLFDQKTTVETQKRG